jgi:glycosyltransferase involved in cell wall biosynthesis
MRIAFVSLMYDAPWGGSEVLWAHTAALALAEGHEILVSVYDWPEQPLPLQKLAVAGAQFFFRSRYQDNLRYRAIDWLTRVPWGGEMPEVRALTKFNPNVALVSQGGWIDLLYHTQLTAWLRKLPYVLICHNYSDPTRQRDTLREEIVTLYQQAQEVLMISGQQLRTLQRQLIDPLINARIVQNPLNLPDAYPVPLTGASDGIPCLAVVASFDVDRKGQDVLLEALSAPEWINRQVRLRFYGKGPDQVYLEKLTDFYGLSDQVQFCGHVVDVKAIWQENDLLVIPSRIESGPMVLQEAMLCGRPVVATDVGMVREWLDDDETGFIADTSSVISLNRALGRAWMRRADWPAMGELAARRAYMRFESNPAKQLLDRLTTLAAVTTVSK